MVTARERVARAWHAGSDHAADGELFGGPLCNCWQVAERIIPMLRDAFDDGWYARALPASRETLNPYEEGRHVDQ